LTELPISIFEFESQAEIDSFFSIDDRVMGGVSVSCVSLAADSIASFRGMVSLDNNGGFASVRAALNSPNLADASALKLRIKGDGKSYKLRLFNSATFDSVAYEQSFRPLAGIWQEVSLPFASFTAVWRGRSVTNSPKFQKHQVCALGLMISEKQTGEFELLIDWIRAS
jgi:NADH dehydrogenase [ubiquinone] 1 alpha subcomplex assembly factor 1